MSAIEDCLHRWSTVKYWLLGVCASALSGTLAFWFDALSQIVEAAHNFGVIYQTERTNRVRLDAYEHTEIARIEAAEQAHSTDLQYAIESAA